MRPSATPPRTPSSTATSTSACWPRTASTAAKTLGLAYIDVPSLVNLAAAFGKFNSASAKETVDNLRHIGGVLFWTGRDGDTVTSDVFVEST